MTKQGEGEACADVPEDVPQSENVDDTRRSGKDVDAEGARSRTPWCVSRASNVLEMSRHAAPKRGFLSIDLVTITNVCVWLKCHRVNNKFAW